MDNRSSIASRLLESIRDAGYTKVSFSKRIGISRPALDKILNNEIGNEVNYGEHREKILSVLNMSEYDLFHYIIKPRPIDVVYSQKASEGRVMSEKAQREYELLLDLVELTSIYV